MKSLSLDDAKFIMEEMTALVFENNEPLAAFESRPPNKLESTLAQPFQSAGNKPAYRTLSKKAAILFYLVTKNHPFDNGNKRMAVMLTSVLCIINKRFIQISADRMYNLSKHVAESHPKDKDEVVKTLDELFKTAMTDISNEFFANFKIPEPSK